MFPCLYFTVNVDFGSFSGRVRHNQKTDSVLEFVHGTIKLWHYFIQIRLHLVTGIMLESKN